MSRVGLTICLICGIQFFGLTLMINPDLLLVWVYRYVHGVTEPIYIFISKKLLYFFTFGGVIVGAILGFLGKKVVITCVSSQVFISGISHPIILMGF